MWCVFVPSFFALRLSVTRSPKPSAPRRGTGSISLLCATPACSASLRLAVFGPSSPPRRRERRGCAEKTQTEHYSRTLIRCRKRAKIPIIDRPDKRRTEASLGPFYRQRQFCTRRLSSVLSELC